MDHTVDVAQRRREREIEGIKARCIGPAALIEVVDKRDQLHLPLLRPCT